MSLLFPKIKEQKKAADEAEFDVRKFERIGWLSKKADKALEVKADERFI